MEHSFGHSPACLFKFNVRWVTFLRVPYESIVNLLVSLTLPGVTYALKWVALRLEFSLSLRLLQDLVS